MDTLFSRYRNAVVLVAVLFLQLVLLAFQVKRERDVPLIRIWAVGVVTPAEKLASGAIRGVTGVWRDYADLRGARQESQRLSEEVNELKLAHHRLQEEAMEARRLERLLQFRESTPSTTIATRVIDSRASETSRVLFLDRGSESGIRPNMAVITPDGIVGKVHRVFRGSAQVLVITDPDSGVGALLGESRIHGALRGVGGFFCQLRYVVNDEKVEPGDRVFTSGEDRIYPKGLPIGTVAAVRNGAVFKEITVQPFARLNRLEEVLVVTGGVDQEIPAKPEPAPVVAETPPLEPSPAAAPDQSRPALRDQGAVSAAARKPPEAGAKAKPLPADPSLSRMRPETDADRLQEAYRAAQAGKTPEQRALGGLLVAPAGGAVTEFARKPPPVSPKSQVPSPKSQPSGSAATQPQSRPALRDERAVAPGRQDAGATTAPRKAQPKPTAPSGDATGAQPQSRPALRDERAVAPGRQDADATSAPRKAQPKPVSPSAGQPAPEPRKPDSGKPPATPQSQPEKPPEPKPPAEEASFQL